MDKFPSIPFMTGINAHSYSVLALQNLSNLSNDKSLTEFIGTWNIVVQLYVPFSLRFILILDTCDTAKSTFPANKLPW